MERKEAKTQRCACVVVVAVARRLVLVAARDSMMDGENGSLIGVFAHGPLVLCAGESPRL